MLDKQTVYPKDEAPKLYHVSIWVAMNGLLYLLLDSKKYFSCIKRFPIKKITLFKEIIEFTELNFQAVRHIVKYI